MADPIQMIRSRQNLKRVRGGRDGLYPFLEHSTWDVVHYFDDFLGDEIRGSGGTPGTYELNTGDDGVLSILADQTNGVAELSASTGAGGDNEYAFIALPELAWTGEQNAVMAVRLNIDAITTVKIEVGFTDVTTDNGAVNVLATPTGTADDCAVWVFDTDDTAYWQNFGNKAGTEATKIEDGLAPVADTFETLIVALRDTNAKFLRCDANGYQTYESAWMTDAITAADKLVPWIGLQLRTGSIDRNLNIDFIDVRQRRSAS
jgi:hypothetical protein